MFTLSDRQLREVSQIIRDHYTSLMINVGLGDMVDPSDVARLKAKGLIAASAQDYPRTVFEFGFFSTALEEAQAHNLSYQDFLRFLTTHPMPMTLTERTAIKAVKRSLSTRIKGLGDTVDKNTGLVIARADAKLRHRLSRTVKQHLIAGIEQRKAVREVARALRDATGEMRRDWLRVARTELQNAFQEGRVAAIQARHPKGYDPRVFKRPAPDCCDFCATLYLEPKSKRPKVFRLSDLMNNGVTNEGRRAGSPRKTSWLPTLGAVHPHCRCVLNELPDGFGFDNAGNMVYTG